MSRLTPSQVPTEFCGLTAIVFFGLGMITASLIIILLS